MELLNDVKNFLMSLSSMLGLNMFALIIIGLAALGIAYRVTKSLISAIAVCVFCIFALVFAGQVMFI